MTGPNENSTRHSASMFGAGAAALRKVIANPLKRRKRDEERADFAFNSAASNDRISAVLETEIVPQLLMAHASAGTANSGDKEKEINRKDTKKLADLPLRLDAPDMLKEVEGFIQQGVTVEEIYLDLLAPAARKLGEMWSNDECDFVDVTMGLWRLQEVMREISLHYPVKAIGLIESRSAVFCPIPGDTHSFGAQMIEEVFARAGWQSEVLLSPQRRELLDYVAHKPVDLVGLTVSKDCPSSALQSLIKAIRSVSKNPHVSIIVGGHCINENPDLVSEIGADGTGIDARSALETAERLVSAAPKQAIY